MQVICENPRIILNPLAPELIAQHGNYYVRGIEHLIVKYKNRFLYEKTKKELRPSALDIKSVDVDTCFVCDCVTKEHYPLYLQVPCGHCDACSSSKVNAFVHRCKLETFSYKSCPIFLTLTYENSYLPESGVSKRDVQLFLKRLRINLFRQGYREKIRYVAVSEYGKLGRAHYHLLLWNLHQSDILSYRQIGETIKKSWPLGFSMHRLVDPSNDKAFYYTTKYLSKNCNVPSGKNKTFCLSSNRNGGISAPYLDRIRQQVVNSLNTKFLVTNPWNSKVEKLQFNRYILQRLFPSTCRSFPPYLKSDVRSFILNYRILRDNNSLNALKYEKKVKQVSDFFRPYFYCPFLSSSEVSARFYVPEGTALRQMLQSEIRIDKAISRGKDYFDSILKFEPIRQKFLSKLFAYEIEVDVSHKAYKYRRDFGLSLERMVL